MLSLSEIVTNFSRSVVFMCDKFSRVKEKLKKKTFLDLCRHVSTFMYYLSEIDQLTKKEISYGVNEENKFIQLIKSATENDFR